MVLAGLFSGQPSFAADPAPVYRVEVVVFVYPGGASDQRPSTSPVDFSAYPDTRANARAAAYQPRNRSAQALTEQERRRRARDQAISAVNALNALEQGIRPSSGPYTGGPVYPQPWISLPALGPDMANAWRRLQDSVRHQPVAWRAWYQPIASGRITPWLRVTDDWRIGIDWLKPEALSQAFVPTEMPVPYRLPHADYRLDGGIRLRERQFMHADIDLIWQEPVSASPSPLADPWAQPGGFIQHRITQSRSIRPGRLEYFDSSWLGVLVRVERWRSPLVEQPSTDSSDQ